MTTIVVPLDGSVFAERALRPAYSLAARLEGARVLMMSCAREDRDVIRRHLDDRAALFSAVVDTDTRLLDDDEPADAILATITNEPDTTLSERAACEPARSIAEGSDARTPAE